MSKLETQEMTETVAPELDDTLWGPVEREPRETDVYRCAVDPSRFPRGLRGVIFESATGSPKPGKGERRFEIENTRLTRAHIEGAGLDVAGLVAEEKIRPVDAPERAPLPVATCCRRVVVELEKAGQAVLWGVVDRVSRLAIDPPSRDPILARSNASAHVMRHEEWAKEFASVLELRAEWAAELAGVERRPKSPLDYFVATYIRRAVRAAVAGKLEFEGAEFEAVGSVINTVGLPAGVVREFFSIGPVTSASLAMAIGDLMIAARSQGEWGDTKEAAQQIAARMAESLVVQMERFVAEQVEIRLAGRVPKTKASSQKK